MSKDLGMKRDVEYGVRNKRIGKKERELGMGKHRELGIMIKK